jgi:hypothetical protein
VRSTQRLLGSKPLRCLVSNPSGMHAYSPQGDVFRVSSNTSFLGRLWLFVVDWKHDSRECHHRACVMCACQCATASHDAWARPALLSVPAAAKLLHQWRLL